MCSVLKCPGGPDIIYTYVGEATASPLSFSYDKVTSYFIENRGEERRREGKRAEGRGVEVVKQ